MTIAGAPMDDTLSLTISPYERQNLIGHGEIERQLCRQIKNGDMHHGWIFAGPRGVGKATLAARLARVLLSGAQPTDNANINNGSLDVDPGTATFRQVASFGHPDLHIVQRAFDEKKSRFKADISVDQIRGLTQFLTHTASGTGARVAIVDAADEMNTNAANALLKVLEEPPENTLLLLLAHAPGRLLATLRSRCRSLQLKPVDRDEISTFVQRESGCTLDEASQAAKAARGAPGYALELVLGDGLGALEDARRFIELAKDGPDVGIISARYGARVDENRWRIFCSTVLSNLAIRAKEYALADDRIAPLQYLAGWEQLSQLVRRGEALNLDRPAMIEAMGYDLSRALNSQ